MERRTPLRRTGTLHNTSPLRRTTERAPRRPKPQAGENATRQVVRIRSNGRCEICGFHPGESMHHRKNRSQGGPWTPSNILHLCGDGTRHCHGRVTDTRAEYYDNGWCVKRDHDPLEQPVLYRGRWVLLDNNGGVVPSLPLGGVA